MKFGYFFHTYLHFYITYPHTYLYIHLPDTLPAYMDEKTQPDFSLIFATYGMLVKLHPHLRLDISEYASINYMILNIEGCKTIEVVLTDGIGLVPTTSIDAAFQLEELSTNITGHVSYCIAGTCDTESLDYKGVICKTTPGDNIESGFQLIDKYINNLKSCRTMGRQSKKDRLRYIIHEVSGAILRLPADLVQQMYFSRLSRIVRVLRQKNILSV